jgi:hypothetical protein
MPVQKLRQNSVRALPYVGRAKQQCIYWDARLTGLGLRVYPSGRRTFVCRYRFRGRKRLASHQTQARRMGDRSVIPEAPHPTVPILRPRPRRHTTDVR